MKISNYIYKYIIYGLVIIITNLFLLDIVQNNNMINTDAAIFGVVVGIIISFIGDCIYEAF